MVFLIRVDLSFTAGAAVEGRSPAVSGRGPLARTRVTGAEAIIANTRTTVNGEDLSSTEVPNVNFVACTFVDRGGFLELRVRFQSGSIDNLM